ncbi:MAG TPA: 16S rRNA (cytosine(967)-C(5))-methyltransferase RsmB [Steroidobacteraceae bacterium]|nr:16S rRNA (cytosine(967)-C(5))-methyltransferase RsmB [Steroidobacteraceae bacterium]
MDRSPWAPGAPALAGAAEVVDAVVRRGQSAEAALSNRRGSADGSAVRAIALGTLRWYLRLSPALEPLLERPEGLAGPVRALLAVAAHQVEYSRNAPELSVHAAVDATRVLGMSRASGLVNAVLRRFVRERAVLFARIDQSLAARVAHPAWLVDRICAAWPDHGEEILTANNAHPPMTLRLDLSRVTRADYLSRLAQQSIEAYAVQWSPYAVTLSQPRPVEEVPGFEDGWVSVQDAGAQLAADLLQVFPGMRVLDACAAPGGKTSHLLELLGDGAEVTAVDIDEERVRLIAANLERLRRKAVLHVGDATDPSTFWDGRPFDRILVDAPCSSTGVIRRHPDIKLLRRPGDVPAFARTQLAALEAACSMLSPRGRLLYSTCSVLPQENEEVIAATLERQPHFRTAELPATSSVPGAQRQRFGVQLLPGAAAGTDGFYYACLEKTTTGT